MARGNGVFARIGPQVQRAPIGNVNPNDFFLHALFARVTLTNGETIEFETKFNPTTNTIELLVPPASTALFNQLTGLQRGPNFQQFVNWLIGSNSIQTTSQKDDDFISSSLLEVWVGAIPTNIDGERLVLILPTEDPAVFGHNTKAADNFTGYLKVSLLWMYLGGANNDFNIRTKVTSTAADGSNVENSEVDVAISTMNLIRGDIRETVLLETDPNINADDIISILVYRNYVGSGDAQTEIIGVVGLKVELISG